MNSLLDTYEVVDLINTKMSQESIQSKNANTLEEKQISKYLNGKIVEGLFVFISISIHKDDKLNCEIPLQNLSNIIPAKNIHPR